MDKIIIYLITLGILAMWAIEIARAEDKCSEECKKAHKICLLDAITNTDPDEDYDQLANECKEKLDECCGN